MLNLNSPTIYLWFLIQIQVFEPCEMVHAHSVWPSLKRTNPKWELDFCGSKNLVLRELHIVGFRPLEQQLTFIKAIVERAPNLQTVVLIKHDEECYECAAMALNVQPRASAWPPFPQNKKEQDMVVGQVTDGASFLGRVTSIIEKL